LIDATSPGEVVVADRYDGNRPSDQRKGGRYTGPLIQSGAAIVDDERSSRPCPPGPDRKGDLISEVAHPTEVPIGPLILTGPDPVDRMRCRMLAKFPITTWTDRDLVRK